MSEETTGRTESEETEKLGFEEALGRLEQIVNELRSENLPLERAFELWEEGQRLYTHCNAVLDSMKRRIEEVRSASAEPKSPSEVARSSPDVAKSPDAPDPSQEDDP